MIQESTQTRFEQLFAPQGNGALSYFYASNKIIANPSAMVEILRDFPEMQQLQQQKILNEITLVLQQVSTNSYCLNSLSQPTIIELLIDIIPNFVDNYLIFNKLLAILDHLLKMSSTDQKLMDKAIKKLIVEFHADERQSNALLQNKSLFATINILKSFFNCKIWMDKEPDKMLVFHGGNGLQIRSTSKKQINWLFSNGVSVYFWLYIENIKFGTQASLPKLFTFYSPNNGGLECYLIDNKIYYRTVGSKYNSPKIGSNGICLGEIQTKKWNFIGIQHEGPKRILGRSHIIFRINDKKFSFNLSPPTISSKQKLQIVFFDKIYCKTSSICILPFYVQNDFAEQLNKNRNSIDLLKNTKALIFEERQGMLYQRNDLGFCSDPVLHRYKQMNFQSILPLFHMYKFASSSQKYPILNQLLSLFVLFLYKSPQNQIEAHVKSYPHVIAHLIKSLPNLEYKFTQETINTILHIKQTITNSDLLAQYHGELLWGFIDSKISIVNKQLLLQIIKNNFTQNVSYFSNIIGLDQMINAIIKLNTKFNRCCEKHYKIMLSRFQKEINSQPINNFGENQLALDYILKIIQLYIQNQKVNSAQQIYKLCRVLSLKFSPCFTLSFMGLIKRILNQKLNQKLNSSQSKKIIQYLMGKKIYIIFLHVIENTFFAEIKAQSVRIIYSLLLKKANALQQEQISHRLSKALWKINEDHDNQGKLSSKHNSPQRKKSKDNVYQINNKQTSFQEESQPLKKSKVNLLKISSLSEDQQSNNESAGSKNKASSIFKQVGPQAPQLTNKSKGSKKFSFNFMNQQKNNNDQKQSKSVSAKQLRNQDENEGFFIQSKSKKTKRNLSLHDEVMEEQKTNQKQLESHALFPYKMDDINQEKVSGNDDKINEDVLKKKKKIKNLGLNIDTEEINKMYTFGGEKGQQILISEQQHEAEIKKIRHLAKMCVAAMKQQKYKVDIEQNMQKQKNSVRPRPPPATTSNRLLRAREQLKLDQLKLIDEQSQPESAMKSPSNNPNFVNTSIASPNFGSKKSKSPTSINSINQQNFIVLYNSLIESCITLPNYELVMPSIMYIFFSWIPQTNLEVKFLFDLSLILDNDQSKQKIRLLVKMPQFYDFLFQLTYKGLLFEQLGEKRLYMQKLQEIIKKVFAFVFRQEPESIDKFSFIIDWSINKAKQYHTKCLLLTTRYVYFLIMDAIEEDLFTNPKNDKLMERNFQYLGITINKFCKFLPIQQTSQSDSRAYIDQYDRIMFNESFEMLASLAPYFTSQWMDYLICEKYYILFKKFFCTDFYSKSLKPFEIYIKTGAVANVQNILTNSLSTQALVLNAQSQYYLKNSFIFTLIDINRLLFIQKMLKNERQCAQKAEIIWQTILIILFAESNKQKNTKNNSQFTSTFLQNCKIFCKVQSEKAAIIIHLLKCIRDIAIQNSMNTSGIYQGKDGKQKEIKTSQTSIKSTPFVQFIMQNYINQKLFDDQQILNFENFKLNFRDVWIPGESHEVKIKSQLYMKFIDRMTKIEDKTPNYLQELSNLMEEQTERASNTEILIETANRQIRSIFRKLWKQLRVFGGPWTHPDLSLQNDTLFNKSLFTYQRYEGNNFYKLRICKHMSKYRLRYLLKPMLNPEISNYTLQKAEDSQTSVEKLQIGLNKALMYYNQNKLLLGCRVMSWIFPKQTATSNPNVIPNTFRQLQILMPFKKVRLIKTLTVRHGYLGIINDKLIFINAYYKEPTSHLSIAQYKLKEDKSFYKLWPLEWIKEMFNRRYVNRRRAIEVCFIHGKSLMFQFYQNDHEQFVKKIAKLKTSKCPNLIYNGNKSLDPKKIYQSQGLHKKWSTYQITNFEYLMELNNLAGRSYCDLTQYPVMPWILINFGTKLVMPEQTNFRNLALPMGALGSEQRTEGFRQRFQNMGEIQTERFHYGTHYSSPGIIYHFLVRLSPFTQGSILLQNGKFDFADRLFFSIIDSFKNATSQYSDVRQLLPQMYTIPQVYLNMNKLNLGVMQNQKRVHNVQLPPWSRQNPFLYISKLRKAFEELIVSKNISKWIDLIFGYKQRGEEAIKNLNCFVHLTYEDSTNFQQIKQQKTVKAIETQILNFGQTPSQLFTKPHPERMMPNTLQISGTICDPNVQPRIYRPSRHASNADLLKDEKQQFNVMKQSAESIIHMRWFKESRLVFIRRNGQMQFYKWHSAQTGSNKIPFQCAIQKEKLITKINKNSPESMEYFDPSLKTDSFPIQFINNGHHIALGGLLDGKLLLIDVDTNSVIQTYIQHSATICSIRSDLKDNFLITGDVDGHVVIWRIINGYKLNFYNSMKDHSQQISSIFISYDLRCLFTSSYDGSVFGYNIITNRKMKVFYHPKKLPINHVVVSTSPLPVIILFCNNESIIYCYSINGQLIQRVHEKEIEHFLSPTLIKDTLGFEHIAYGNEHGDTIFRMLPFLDNSTKHVVAKEAAVNRVCLSKSSKFVIVGCSDGQLSVITAPDQPTQIAK